MTISEIIYVLKKVISHIESDSPTNWWGICSILEFYTNTDESMVYIQEEILEPEFRELPTYKCFECNPILCIYSKIGPSDNINFLNFHFENKSQRIEFLEKLIKKLENKES